MTHPFDPAEYRERGYAITLDALSADAIAALNRRAAQIIAEFDPAAAGAPFSTDEDRRAIDRYFLESGDRVRCFLEDLPSDGSTAPRRAVNKIGHALHHHDPVFAPHSTAARWAPHLAAAGLSEPRAVQSMYIAKDPGVGGEVAPHQDAAFLHDSPPTVTGLWFALADADRHNGCLWALPGAHRAGLKRRFVREGDATRFIELDRTPWPTDGWIPLEVPAGALIVLHGLLPHRSEANRSDRGRPAYAVHFVDRAAQWSADNWIVPA